MLYFILHFLITLKTNSVNKMKCKQMSTIFNIFIKKLNVSIAGIKRLGNS